jgi:hypothetical protein
MNQIAAGCFRLYLRTECGPDNSRAGVRIGQAGGQDGISMNELLNKISSYNIFNFLFPGIIFSILSSDAIHYPVDQSDTIGRLFLYYFVGLVLSRVGSLTIEPVLKKTKFVRFAEYKDYVTASRKDPKIELFSEVNNTYRTLSALFGLLLIVRLYARLNANMPCWQGWEGAIVAALFLVMFLFSYKKQTAYITKRIDADK